MLTPVFVAHRGYAAEYPENTLIALAAAHQAGARYVEVDIQLSADLIPVLFHDRNLQRLCGRSGAIHDYTYSQLKKFNVAYSEKFGDKFTGNKMTSLQKFISYLKEHAELNAFIELKRSMIEIFGEEVVIKSILPLFDGLKNKISFISYNHHILQTIENQSEYSTGAVVDLWDDYKMKSEWQPEWLFCADEGLPGNDAELAISPKVVIFEVSNVEQANKLLSRGIQYLETFRIKEMLLAFSNESAR